MNELLSTIAPTVLSAFLGPASGVVLAGLGKIFGIDNATTKDITKAISDGKLTPEQISSIKELELKLQADEQERGFKYKELEYKDTQGAREMQIATKSLTPSILTWIVVVITLVCEGIMLFNAIPPGADPIILGRILGTMDSALMLVLGFWFGSSHGSQNKDQMLAQSQPIK